MTDRDPSTGDTRVLLVEDDPETLVELQEILKLEDIPTSAAGSIDEAYACLGADPQISVVITEDCLTAPCGAATHGADFAALAERRFPERQLSFVLLSGETNMDVRPCAASAVDVLPKPLVADALISAIRRGS